MLRLFPASLDSPHEPFFAIEPMAPLFIDHPALAPEHHMQMEIPKPGAGLRLLSQPYPEHGIVPTMAAIEPGGALKLHHPVRTSVCVQGLEFFCEHLLEPDLVQGQVGHELFQPPVFLFQQAEAPNFGHSHLVILLPPEVSNRSAHSPRPSA